MGMTTEVKRAVKRAAKAEEVRITELLIVLI
jgi:hypothetical protein